MREKIVFLGIIGLIVGLAVDLGLMIEVSWDNSREAYAQQACEKVQTFTGNGIKDTQPFTVTSDTWRLRYKFESTTGNQQLSSFDLTVYKPGNTIPESIITLERPGSDTSYVNAGAGTYYLSIGSANATWTVTVEDCGSSAPSGTPNPSSVSASASASTSASPLHLPLRLPLHLPLRLPLHLHPWKLLHRRSPSLTQTYSTPGVPRPDHYH